MRLWEVQNEWGIDNLQKLERPDPASPGKGEVAIKMHAASLNYRDYATVTGKAPFGAIPQIPLSDGSGEVIAVGEGVTRFSVGDRVCPTFFTDWTDGRPSADNRKNGRGSSAEPGILQDVVVTSEEAASAVPDHLNWLEAATLPCAALTAWRGLVVEADVQAGDIVVVQGTGGVSTFALQFAKMRGATVIVTSSSDEKLAHAKELGADHLINYRENPEWSKSVMEITGGKGAQVVVEVGGAGTVNQSIAAAAVDGQIVIIGVLGGRGTEVMMPAIFSKNLHIHGISVGNRVMFEEMCDAISKAKMKPLIGEVFGFDEVREAFRALEAQGHMGKICIDYSK